MFLGGNVSVLCKLLEVLLIVIESEFLSSQTFNSIQYSLKIDNTHTVVFGVISVIGTGFFIAMISLPGERLERERRKILAKTPANQFVWNSI